MKRSKILIIPRKNSFEDFRTLSQIEKIFQDKRGHVFKVPQKEESVILLLSGGLDSICLWNFLMEKYKLHVYPIYFLNSERIKQGKEISIHTFSKIFKTKYPRLFHEVYIKKYTPSFSFSKVKDKNKILYDLPTIINNLLYHPTYKLHLPAIIDNPSRLGIFCFGAYEYAYFLRFNKGVSINTIFLGIVPEDSRSVRESTLTVLRSINLSFCLILGNFNWQITAPIEKKWGFYFTKKNLARYALKNDLPLEKTWSCGRNYKIHCGHCVNCETRKMTFQKLHFADKTKYQKRNPFILVFKKKINKQITSSLNHLRRKLKKWKSDYHFQITSSTKISHSPRAAWHEENNSVYILNKETGIIEQLNTSGSIIWKEISKGSTTYSHLIDTLKETYNIAEVKLRRDLDRFLKKNIQKDYLIVK